MLSVTRCLLSLRAPICVTPIRGTVIVERWYNVPLAKEGKEPYLHPRRHRIYRMVEDTKKRKKEKMELILTQSVDKLGTRGDTVMVEKSIGRNKLLAQGLAVYPSAENKRTFEEEKARQASLAPEERQQTWTAEMTVKFLKSCRLPVRMRDDMDWTLTKEIVARQFFKSLGVVVPTEALRIPDEPISTFGEFWCEVTVNGINVVRMPMDVVKYDGPRSRRFLLWQMREEAKQRLNAESPPEGSSTPESTVT